MIECDKFHETKSERKYYEDKKQEALRYLDKMIRSLEFSLEGQKWDSNIHMTIKGMKLELSELKNARKLVDRI